MSTRFQEKLAKYLQTRFPRHLNFGLSYTKLKSGYADTLDYYQYYNLANQNYSDRVKLCPQELKLVNFSALIGVFSPYGVTIGSSLSQVKKVLGKPLFKIFNCPIIRGYKTYYYKRKINHLKLTFQLHFHNRVLFLAQVNIQNESTNQDTKDLIKSLIFDHQTIDESPKKPLEELQYFKDCDGNSISTCCDHFKTQIICYDPSNSTFVDLMLKKKSMEERVKDKYKSIDNLIVKTY